MSTEQNKNNMSRLFVDLFSNGDFSVADELVQPDFVEHSGLPGLPDGIPGLKAIAQILRIGFPDFKVTIDDAIAEGDRVSLRITTSGTQSGEVFGIPPSGKYAAWQEVHVMRCKDGKMAEHWDVLDIMSMMRQIGAIPAPGHA